MIKISLLKLKANLRKFADLNLKISRAWKGYGSALFLELGELHEELAWEKDNEPVTTKVGEFTLSSAGGWKLFKNKTLLLAAENASSENLMKAMKSLNSQTIKSITISNKLQIELSDKMMLEFYKADYGFFTLVSNEKPSISYEDNGLYAHNQYFYI